MKNLDWLASVICDVLEENLGAGYAHGKRERLSGVDRFGILVWMNELDSGNLHDIAKKLDVDTDELDQVRKFVRQL